MVAPVTIKSIEGLGEDYSLYTWPCAPVLAQYLYSQRDYLKGKKVLELGAGTAVPGLVAAKCGAHVTFSDREGRPHFNDVMMRSCKLNNISQEEDIVIASDCFYDSKDFEDVLATVSFLFEKNLLCKFWTTYQERSSNRTLIHLFNRWSLQCTAIPLRSFQPDGQEGVVFEGLGGTVATEHTIHMWEVCRKQQ